MEVSRTSGLKSNEKGNGPVGPLSIHMYHEETSYTNSLALDGDTLIALFGEPKIP